MAADEANSKGAGKASSARGRREKAPVTLDLEAKVVPPAREQVKAVAEEPETSSREEPLAEASAAKDAPEGAEVSARVTAGRDWRNAAVPIAAGAAGGLAVILLGFGLQAAGLLPAPGRTAAIKALTQTSGLEQRLTAVEAANAQTIADRAAIDDVSKRVGVVDAFGSSLSDRLLNVEASIASVNERLGTSDAAATKQSLDAIAERVQRLEGAPPASGIGAAPPASPELASRIDAVERNVAALQAKVDQLATVPAPAPATESDRAARAIAIESLRRSAERGGSFTGEVGALGAFGLSQPQLAELSRLAEKGAPSRAELIAEFPVVADAILTADRPSSGDGIFDRMLAYGRDLVKIRPIGPIAGNDVSAVVSRMQAAVDAGNLAGALSERTALPSAGQAASEPWAGKAADRIAIDNEVEKIGNALGVTEGSG